MSARILIVVNTQITGVEYHRQLIPHYHLNSHYKDDFEVHQINEIESASDDFLKQFQLIQFSRMVSWNGNSKAVLDRLKRMGIVSILDIDDYWELYPGHLLYDAYLKNRISEQTLVSLKNTDHITTTTSFFADLIKKINPFVTVLPNAIDPAQPQFDAHPSPSSLTRFGWVGGVCHLHDLQLLQDGIGQLHHNPKLNGKYQLYLMGFNPEDNSGMYQEFEEIFTTGLLKNDNKYFRINAANVFSYAQGYNLFDIALAPLTQNRFNNCKSELKMIEAGFMKKAMIVSDIMPYKIIARPGINCLSVKETAYRSAWYLSMKRLINNPNLVQDLASQLHEDVTNIYHIEKVNQVRADLYRSLLD